MNTFQSWYRQAQVEKAQDFQSAPACVKAQDEQKEVDEAYHKPLLFMVLSTPALQTLCFVPRV